MKKKQSVLAKVLFLLSLSLLITAAVPASVSAEESGTEITGTEQTEIPPADPTDPDEETAGEEEEQEEEPAAETQADSGGDTSGDEITYYDYTLELKEFESFEAQSAETSYTFSWDREPEPDTGMKFSGWAESSGGDVAVVPAGTMSYTLYSDDAERTLYPVWEEIRYTIRFVTDGGGTIEPVEYTISDTEEIDLPEPEREGYVFDGWSVTEDGGNWPDTLEAGTSIDEGCYGDVTLTAVWVQEYSVTLNPENGEESGTIRYTSDNPPELTEPQKDGYEFTGWAVISSDGTWPETIGADEPELAPGYSGNVELTAEWEAVEYSIVFTEAELDDMSYTIEEGIELPVPAKEGYEFTGWEIVESEGNWEDVETIPAEDPELEAGYFGNVELKALWTPLEYSIVFTETAETDPAEMTYTVETDLTLPEPAKEGYEFTGWRILGSDGNWVEDETIPADGLNLGSGYAGDVELEAVWTPVVYTIDFVTGFDAMYPTVDYTVDAEEDILLPVPVRSGYDFAGWQVVSEEDSSWPVEIPAGTGDPADGLPVTAGVWGNVTLEAVWTECAVTIQYIVVGDGGSVSTEQEADEDTDEDTDGDPKFTEVHETVNAVTGEPCVICVPEPGYAVEGWYTDEECTVRAEKTWFDPERNEFRPEKDEDAGQYADAVYYVKFEMQLGSLAISAEGHSDDQDLIFRIEGETVAEKPGKVELTVVLPAGEPGIAVGDLPVGEYTVRVQNSWSWRYGETDVIEIEVVPDEKPEDPEETDGEEDPAEAEDPEETKAEPAETEAEKEAAEEKDPADDPDAEEELPGQPVEFVLERQTDAWLSGGMHAGTLKPLKKKEE